MDNYVDLSTCLALVLAAASIIASGCLIIAATLYYRRARQYYLRTRHAINRDNLGRPIRERL